MTTPDTNPSAITGAWGGLPPHPPKNSKFNKEKGLKPLIFKASPETELHFFITTTKVPLTNYFFVCYNVNVMVMKKWAKPPMRKKLQRDYELKRYASFHPKATLAEIGRLFHITRQRVSIILKVE